MITRALISLVVALVVWGCSGMDGTKEEVGKLPGGAPVSGYTTQPAHIYVDGDGEDWEELAVRYRDLGDGGAVDLERLWMAHTERYLFFRIEVGRPINLQEGNALTLYLDTDNDPTTGEKALGLGAELSWSFGERTGQFEDGSEVNHADIGLTSLPTVRSNVFEVALDRSATPEGSTPLFQNDTLRVALSNGGDRLPNGDGGIGYILSDAETRLDVPSLEHPAGADLRLLSQNAVHNFERERSSLFAPDHQPHYRRIIQAVGPDVIAFQEIYSHTATETEHVVEGDLGVATEWEWAKQGPDLVLGSRYPILDTHAIPGYGESKSGAFLLDAEEALGTKLLAINMHPPCCNYGPEDGEPSRNAQRQQVVDGVAAFLRRVKNGEGPFGVESGTPVVILGDMNFVGDDQQPRTLRTGDIVNTDRFGGPAAPDWDGTALLDTNPRQTGTPMHTTWIDPESSFPPGRLDYGFVTDSVLEVVHEYVLFTPALPESVRRAHGLQGDDTVQASDHLPLVIDVSSR